MADAPTTPDAPKKPAAAKKPAAPRKAAGASTTAPKPAAAKAPVTTAPAAKAPARKTAAPKPAAARKPATARTASKAPAKRKTATAAGKSTGKWGTAAIAGGVAAVGVAAGAALFALRGSSAVSKITETVLDKTGLAGDPASASHAHQADGADSSASFKAGIADEGTVPE